VRKAGNRLRVTAQLVKIDDGYQIWSERYDRQMADVFDVQDEIARAIAEKLKVTLTGGESPRLVKRVTGNLQAYDLHLRGRALLLKRGKAVAEAADCFRRAVDLDPNFAAAWAGLADAYTVSGYFGTAPPAETMPKALTAARRAVQLDPGLAEGYCALAMALLLWERDYDGADDAFRRCVALNPQYTQGRCWHAMFNLQWVRGRMDEGVAEARQALAGDPLSAYAAAILALVLGTAGQTAEAIGFARVATSRDPDALLTRWIHLLVAHWHGAFEEAETAMNAAARVSDRHPFTLGHGVLMYADWGRPADARALWGEIQARVSRGEYFCCTTRAIAAAAVGEQDLALELSQQACDEREPLLILMARTFPDSQCLRDDPRFAQVLRRLSLPELGPAEAIGR
jgi:tetratricopeptide (TPR) repeat protein